MRLSFITLSFIALAVAASASAVAPAGHANTDDEFSSLVNTEQSLTEQENKILMNDAADEVEGGAPLVPKAISMELEEAALETVDDDVDYYYHGRNLKYTVPDICSNIEQCILCTKKNKKCKRCRQKCQIEAKSTVSSAVSSTVSSAVSSEKTKKCRQIKECRDYVRTCKSGEKQKQKTCVSQWLDSQGRNNADAEGEFRGDDDSNGTSTPMMAAAAGGVAGLVVAVAAIVAKKTKRSSRRVADPTLEVETTTSTAAVEVYV